MAAFSASEMETIIKKSPRRRTPYLVVDTNRLRQTCRAFREAFPGDGVYFSMKANNTPEVLRVIAEEGINFDAASWGEIQILKGLGISPERIVFNAPTKLPEDVRSAYRFGVRTFAFDSWYELDKLARLAPGSNVIARVAVDNEGSGWPLDRKFGVEPSEAVAMFQRAVILGLKPFGTTFHVGSQNRQPEAWAHALDRCADVWKKLEEKGIYLEVVDVGGGFPTEYTAPVPSIEETAEVIRSAVHRLFPAGTRVIAEPGRCLVADAGFTVTRIVNLAERNGDLWLYVDNGVYHGLLEPAMEDGFRFSVLALPGGPAPKSSSTRNFVLAGATCDSFDTIMEDVELPENLIPGDLICFLNTGAYTTSMEHYNGITFPRTVMF